MMAEPTREEMERMSGPVVVEFGAAWCPYCQAIRSTMAELLKRHAQVRHIQVEDGRGRPLGRSFRVTLWPTLIFMRDGQVIGRAVRPSSDEIATGFAKIVGARAGDELNGGDAVNEPT